MKWWKPALALGALATLPFTGPLALGALGLGGAGAVGGGAAAGATAGAMAGAQGLGAAGGGLGGVLAGLGGAGGFLHTLGPTLLQAGLGYAAGGPQGALQVPLMAAAGAHREAGMGLPKSTGILGALGGHSGVSSLLGGLAGRAMGGGAAGGLAGMGMGGMLNPWASGPLHKTPPQGPKPPIPGAMPGVTGKAALPWWLQNGEPY